MLEKMTALKASFMTLVGMAGGGIAQLFGGWGPALTTLMVFMAIDYITGIITAGVFHKSEKTKSGALESHEGWKGLCRKGGTLLVVLVAYRLDIMLGSSYLKDAVIIAFIANETISIIENVGLMGVPIPAQISRAIEVLKENSGDDNDGSK